jgi:hypothetical protein
MELLLIIGALAAAAAMELSPASRFCWIVILHWNVRSRSCAVTPAGLVILDGELGFPRSKFFFRRSKWAREPLSGGKSREREKAQTSQQPIGCSPIQLLSRMARVARSFQYMP